ncbi:hypothetical protein Rhopal_005137-T1 [Rhodotorula paludigena]|uniref:DNA ligase n=1 Tax=Rhodotorula paludigena TaxID=86838 RepID=A0AAV5GU33_9BASI|nr:hypothetical protein Rhopal_005137-T1 [Rhodotorula paludigena]
MPRNFKAERPPRKRDEDDDHGEGEGELQQARPDDLEKPPGIENGPTPPFGVVCELFEHFESITRNKHKKHEKKADILRRVFERWREETGPDLYPLIRLMLPERDNRRRTYNLKEQKLAKAIANALDLPPHSSDALKLINWKVPTAQDPAAGEFASVAKDVIKSRSMVVHRISPTTVDEANQVLDDLAFTRQGPTDEKGNKRSLIEEHSRILRRCTSKMTPNEMKWLIRIILRAGADLKIGMGEKTIFDSLHPDANSLFNTCSDIKRVCWQLYDPHKHLKHEDFTVTPGSDFRPMLCWRNQRSLSDVIKAMRVSRGTADPNRVLKEGEYASNEFIVEEKLDGERIQLHKLGDEYHYSSRRAKDYTYLYGKDSRSGSLTPFIQDCINPEVDQIVLDGEMLVWDPTIEKYMPFGNLKTFALTKTPHIGPNDPRPCFKVFDILFLKGKNGEGRALINHSLWQRKQMLARMITPKKGVIEIADCAKGKSVEDIREYLMRILEERGEGLVVKNPQSFYALGGRETSWIKIKPEYMDELGEKIDGLVVGGYWGQGRRGGLLASYLIGLREEVDGQMIIRSFAKVGSGLARSDYAWIIENKADKWIEFDRKKPETVPSWFKTVSEWPDVLIAPEDSFIIEVKAAEIVGGGAVKIRDDLNQIKDSCDFATALAFRSMPKKRAFGDDLSTKNKTVRTGRSTKARSVSTAVGKVEAKSSIFDGITFFIFSTKPAELKDELQKKIVEHGGNFMQKIPPEELDRIVVASEYKGISSRKGGKNLDVYHPNWILESIRKERRLPPLKRYLVHATEKTAASADFNADEDDRDEMDVIETEEAPMQANQLAAPLLPERDRGWRGEDVEDSEDDPETEDDEEKERRQAVQQASDSEDQGPASPFDVSLFTRRGTLPAEVNKVNQDVGRMQLDSTENSQKEEDLFKVDKLKLDPDALTDAPVGLMPAEGDAREFDPDFLFRPLVAYFDTAPSAVKNGLTGSDKPARVQARADSSLDKAREAFVANHGTATDDLADPKLTHIIVTKLVPERYKELIKRTSEPRYRRLVTTEWIDASIEEEGLMDEDDFKP